MRAIFWSVLAVLAVSPRAVPAQWSVSAELGVLLFAGGSVDTNDLSVHPYRSTSYALGIDRQIGRMRVGVEARYANTGLGAESPDVAIVLYDILSLIEIAPLVSLRVVRFGEGLSLWAGAGPVLNIWRFEGEDDRHRWGGRVGAAVEWPITGRLTGGVRVGETLTPSLFERSDFEEDDSGARRRAMWRTSVALALRVRF